MKRHGLLVCLVLAWTAANPAVAQRASVAVSSPRQTFEFSRGWRMHVGDDATFSAPSTGDAGWQPVTLPHAFNEDQAFAVDGHNHAEGIIWYRKHFRLPADAPKGRAFLEFQGARQAADVWVNGEKVGFSENGVMASGFDITKALSPATISSRSGSTITGIIRSARPAPNINGKTRISTPISAVSTSRSVFI